MSSEQIIWVLVAIVVVVALVAVALMASKRRGSAKVEHRRHEAEQLREDAVAGASGLTSSRAEAQEARAEAEAARARATQAERGAAMDEATVEDRVREADRVDPDVDHRSDDYRPETPGPRGDATTSPTTEPTASRTAPPPRQSEPNPETDPDATPRGDHRR